MPKVSPSHLGFLSSSTHLAVLFHSYGMLRTSKGAACSIAWVGDKQLLAGSSDHTVFLFDLKSGEVIRRFRGHYGVVNSVDVQRGGQGQGLFASASDDGSVMVWSPDLKEALDTVELGYPITAVKWSEDGQSLYIGGIDNDVHVYSLASRAISYSLRSHSDTITSLSLSPAASHLLSSSMDSVLHLWSIQPFAPTVNAQNATLHPRLVRSFYGAPAGFEGLLRKASWSKHRTATSDRGGSLVCAGGADRSLTVWDASTGESGRQSAADILECELTVMGRICRRDPIQVARAHGNCRGHRLAPDRARGCIGWSRRRFVSWRG